MNRINTQNAYVKKPVPSGPYHKYSARPGPKYNRKRRTRGSAVKTNANPDSIFKSLSSINLVSILNSFYTIRSTVKDLKVSLEKLDSAMDSAYQMFEIAQGVLKQQQSRKRRPPLQLLPPVPNNRMSRQRRPPGGFNQPSQEKPDDAEAPLAGLFENVDIGQIMAMMQSPLVQGLLKQFLQGDSAGVDESNRQAKEG